MSVDFCRHRVYPHYPVASDWRPCTPWEMVDGSMRRTFRSQTRRGCWRRAYIYRSAGGWRWKVLEVSGAGRRRRVTEFGRSAADVVYPLAPNAYHPAETAATTK